MHNTLKWKNLEYPVIQLRFESALNFMHVSVLPPQESTDWRVTFYARSQNYKKKVTSFCRVCRSVRPRETTQLQHYEF